MTPPSRLLPLVLLMAAVPARPQQTSSPDDFLKQILAAIAAKDQQALERFTITEAEFRQCVWPSVAGSVSGSNTSEAKYYQRFSSASKMGIAERMAELAGQNYTWVKSSFGAEKRQKGCRLLPAPTVAVRGADGTEKTVSLGAGVVEVGGSYKVTSYYVPPRNGK
jgi:hypothetical protein